MKFNKGDILTGQGYGEDPKKAYHPIIYIQGDTDNDFIGVMLTSSSEKRWKNNFALKEEHFETLDENGTYFQIKFKNSHCVHLLLNKRAEWAPFYKKGQLTNLGLEFILYNIKESEPIYWDDYINSITK